MNEFIICLIKYTATFICILYAYSKLMRTKLKLWDVLDIPLFAVFSSVLYFTTVYMKILVPVGFFIFGTVFLFLRFRKTLYETITVSTIALGFAIVISNLSIVFGYIVATALNVIKNETFRIILAQLIVAIIQVLAVCLLFKNKRFKSGVYPKSKNATFDVLLYLSVICIFTMMLLYAEEVKQYMLNVVLLVFALCGLLLIIGWRKHISYNYRDRINSQYADRMEDTLKEYKFSSAENDLQVAVYAKLFHYLNKAVPDCALLAERASTQNGSADSRAVRDMLRRILREMNIANEKCSLQNIPQTGVKVIDATIMQLYTAAERKNFKASAKISANVESWFTGNGLHKDDIHILLSYLCDNAINSALGAPNAKVRVELGSTADLEPLIRIYDSGEQFDETVLAKFGLEQITTRAGAGGNGIGLFTVFEILIKYGASFTLDESPQYPGFTKAVEIAFDGRRSVTVRTFRKSVVAACSSRKEITVELIDGSNVETLRDGTDG